ncbi:MAG: hypothetical protein K2X29_04855 [Candidatus Obscuribacterales bacterium]|nr:hypothetical protein [Candidatus Obscuribacterales bacterium]
MTLKHLTLKLLAALITLTQLCYSCPSAYADSYETPSERYTEAAYDSGDMIIDAIIEKKLDGANLPFAQRELFALIVKTAMRNDMDHPKEYLREDLLQNILKEALKNRVNPFSKTLDAAQTLFELQNIILQIQLARIASQILRLDPFAWETPLQTAEKIEVIIRTQKQLDSINKVTRLQGSIDGPPSHLFELGPAYRQLVDISRNGWDRSLNWDPSVYSQPGIMTGLPNNAPENSPLVEDFSDINDNLKDAVASSDQALEQFHEDVDANGTTKLLEAIAQQNVQLTDKMQKMEAETVKANIRALAIGVAVGVAGTALGMAMQSAPAMRSSYGYGHSTPSGGSVSGASRAIQAPSMGGSFDGAAGQTLFTRF